MLFNGKPKEADRQGLHSQRCRNLSEKSDTHIYFRKSFFIRPFTLGLELAVETSAKRVSVFALDIRVVMHDGYLLCYDLQKTHIFSEPANVFFVYNVCQ